MNKKTREALEGSIEKWTQIVRGEMPDLGDENCELCHVFFERIDVHGRLCTGCPVREKTHRTMCQGTPYERWSRETSALTVGDGTGVRVANTPTRLAAAQAELRFLKSLRDA